MENNLKNYNHNSFEIKIKEQIKNFIIICKNNKKIYKEIMEKLFTSFDSTFEYLLQFKIPKKSISEIKDQINNNINILYQKIRDLNENEEKNFYGCLSCIYAAFLGDAIGAFCEFEKPSIKNIKKIFHGKPKFGDNKGQVTDDSEMAMCLSFGIMDSNNLKDINPNIIYNYYGSWAKSKPKDIGRTTRHALNYFDFNFFSDPINYENIFKEIQKINYNSQANGFLMRISPFIVWCNYAFKNEIENTFKSKENIIDLYILIKAQAEKDCRCTHPNPLLPAVSACFCLLALGAINQLKPKELIDDLKKLISNQYFDENKEESEIKKIILEELSIYENIKDNFDEFEYFTKGEKAVIIKMGYFIHSFRLTLYFLYFFDKILPDTSNHKVIYSKFRVIMNKICSFGGDTDTNAAIVATVIGPLIGYKNFEEDEFKKMFFLIPYKRNVFIPSLMVLYVYYLEDLYKNENVTNENNLNFLKMILEFCYCPIDNKYNNLKKKNKHSINCEECKII